MKAILIARVSTEEQREAGNSLPAQMARLERYCKNKDFEIIKRFEFDESAYKKDRREFDRIIDFISSQKDKVAVCLDRIDRMSRNTFDRRLALLDDLVQSGRIELHFASDGQILRKGASATNNFQYSMGLSLARYYSDVIGDNVDRSFEEKIRKGEWLSKAPFGYKNISKKSGVDSDIVFDEDKAPIAKMLFENYATGAYSMSLLQEKVKEEFGLDIPKGSIGKILKNPFYYGEMLIKREIKPHRYEPLISRELFDKVQEIKAGFRKKPVKYRGKNFMYRGLLKCAHCGCAISPDQKKGKYVYYQCTQYHGKHGAKRFKEEAITELLGDAFKRMQVPKKVLDKIVAAMSETHKSKVEFHNKHYDKWTREYKALTKKMDNLYEDKLDGKIPEEQYDRFYEKFRKQKDETSARLEKLQAAEDNYYITAKYLLDLSNRAFELFKSSEVEERRLLVKLVLSNLRVDGEKVLYDVNKPFNIIVDCHDRQSWRG